MRYLKGTTNLGIKYTCDGSNELELIGYSDADWGGDMKYKISGGAVFLRSKKRTCLALSTARSRSAYRSVELLHRHYQDHVYNLVGVM